jgi:hypothetical protein
VCQRSALVIYNIYAPSFLGALAEATNAMVIGVAPNSGGPG